MSIPFKEPSHRPVEAHRDADDDAGDAVEVRRLRKCSGPQHDRCGHRGANVPELVPAKDFRAMIVMERPNDAVDQDVPEKAGDCRWPGVFVGDRLSADQRLDADQDPDQTTSNQGDHVDDERRSPRLGDVPNLRIGPSRKHERYSRHDEKQNVSAVVQRITDECSTIGQIDRHDFDNHHADLNQQGEEPLSPS